jgi:hypothetical protein
MSVAATALVSVPSHADTDAFRDRVGDLRAGADLHKVVVRNERRLVLKFKHEDLRDGYYAGVTAYIDTTRRRIGPEYGIGGGIGGDSDWQMFRARRWKAVGSGPINCPSRLRVDYRNDTSKFVIPRRCLDGAGRVRVSVVANDDDGDRDWAPKFHRFYDWVGR